MKRVFVVYDCLNELNIFISTRFILHNMKSSYGFEEYDYGISSYKKRWDTMKRNISKEEINKTSVYYFINEMEHLHSRMVQSSTDAREDDETSNTLCEMAKQLNEEIVNLRMRVGK